MTTASKLKIDGLLPENLKPSGRAPPGLLNSSPLIGVKFCGNCNPVQDTGQLLQTIKNLLPEATFVCWEKPMQILLILNGCTVACATRPAFQGPLLLIAGNLLDLKPYPPALLPEAVVKKINTLLKTKNLTLTSPL